MPHAEIAIAKAPALTAVLFGLSGCLVDFGSQARTDSSSPDSQATPGALKILRSLKEQGVPCAWLDELPPSVTTPLAAVLPGWLKAASPSSIRWPAPPRGLAGTTPNCTTCCRPGSRCALPPCWWRWWSASVAPRSC